jgi:hypothetical protein
MLPNVAPTGQYVEIPMLGVIKFRGDKLCHEHIYWGQASVLVQIGLLDPTGLPVAGIETAKKLPNVQLPSNTKWAVSNEKCGSWLFTYPFIGYGCYWFRPWPSAAKPGILAGLPALHYLRSASVINGASKINI